jgi:putative SOS response-associated peptidase YedK
LSTPAKEGQTSSLLRPYPAEAMTAYPVDARVNSPKHNDAACVAPLAL